MKKLLSVIALVVCFALIGSPAGAYLTPGSSGTTTTLFAMSWDGYLGIVTSAATSTAVAPCAGHFTSLSCVATLTGTCTTVPVVNVTDVTSAGTGTASTLTTTVGTPVTHAQTLTFASGDVIGFAQTASPATCTTPMFACNATLSCP